MTDVRVIGQYRRSKDGKTIHLEPCTTKGGVPWSYAKDKSLREVVADVRAIEWLHLCRRCWPADAITEAETR